MKPLTHCPFCNDQLSLKPSSKSSADAQYLCRGKDDHTYIQVHTIPIELCEEVYHIKIRVGPGEVRYYFSGYYTSDYNMISMWQGRNNLGEQLHLNEKIYPDFSKGIQGMVDFIKMHLVFN